MIICCNFFWNRVKIRMNKLIGLTFCSLARLKCEFALELPRDALCGIPRNSKIFIFKPKFLFLRENHENDWEEFLDFYEVSLFMIFHENSHFRNVHFKQNRENHI